MSTETPSANQELEDVQTRLMRMLDSVRLEKAEETPGAAEPAASSCPHCGSQEPWGMSSWCPDCGYYPKLGRAVSPAEVEEVESGELKLPPGGSWLGILGAGLAFLLVASIFVREVLVDPAERGEWAMGQMVLGFGLFLVAHVRAYVLAAQKTDSISPTCFFFEPAQLWLPVMKQLPTTRKTVWAGSWGLLAAVLALFVIGLDWGGMFSHVKTRRKINPLKTIMKVASATTGNSAFSSASDAEEEAEEEEPVADPTAVDGAAPQNLNPASMEQALQNFAEDAGAVAMDQAGLADGGGKSSGKSTQDSFGKGGSFTSGNQAGAGQEGDGTGTSLQDESRGSGGSRDGLSPDTTAEGGRNQKNGTTSSFNSNTSTGSQKPLGETTGDDKSKQLASEKTGKLPIAQNSSGKNSNPQPPIDQGNQSEFLAFGYLTNASGELRSVLLAEIKDGRGRFVSKLSLDNTDPALCRQLQKVMEEVRSNRPLLPAPYNAYWVRPVVKCLVTYDGWTSDGQIRNGSLVVIQVFDNQSGQWNPLDGAVTR